MLQKSTQRIKNYALKLHILRMSNLHENCTKLNTKARNFIRNNKKLTLRRYF